jgi:hypothetical protein
LRRILEQVSKLSLSLALFFSLYFAHKGGGWRFLKLSKKNKNLCNAAHHRCKAVQRWELQCLQRRELIALRCRWPSPRSSRALYSTLASNMHCWISFVELSSTDFHSLNFRPRTFIRRTSVHGLSSVELPKTNFRLFNFRPSTFRPLNFHLCLTIILSYILTYYHHVSYRTAVLLSYCSTILSDIHLTFVQPSFNVRLTIIWRPSVTIHFRQRTIKSYVVLKLCN